MSRVLKFNPAKLTAVLREWFESLRVRSSRRATPLTFALAATARSAAHDKPLAAFGSHNQKIRGIRWGFCPHAGPATPFTNGKGDSAAPAIFASAFRSPLRSVPLPCPET